MKSSRAFKVLSIVMLVAVVLYFGTQIYQYLSSPLSTTLTYEATVEDSIAVTGWVIRREEAFRADSTTVIYPLDEGQRVGVGQTFATAYHSASALETVNQIRELELHLQQLDFAMTSVLDKDAALKLDRSITGSILSLRQVLSGGDYSAAAGDASALKASVLKSSLSYSSPEEINAAIKDTQQQIARLQSQLQGALAVTAPRSGVFSAVCDGFESVLTPARLRELTPSSLRALAPESQPGNAGKLVYGDTWYFAAPMDARRAGQLRPGQTVTLRMAKGMSRDVAVQVFSVNAAEEEQAVVVFSCRDYLPQTTLLRHQAAELVFQTYQGLRVPITALRLNEEGVSGVYCVVGVSARFKPVRILYRGDTYMLVRPVDDAAGTAVLRSGDEIILTASQLENGLVIR